MATAKLLLADFAPGLSRVPSNYIRKVSERPNLGDVQSSDSSIPLIDLQHLSGSNRANVIKEIGLACENHGFFQVRNHGIPESVVNNMMATAKEFFQLPMNERMKNYSDDSTKTTRLSTSFNVKTESVSNWRDFLRFHCHPLDKNILEWPTNPPSFRKNVTEYCTNVRELTMRLLRAISESLGLEMDYMDRAFHKHGQHMVINYYPPCPQPDLTYGLPGHTDPNAITILLQDDVPGLQVLHDDKWIAVNPIPNTFIINIGDQIQVLSNDRYKSVLHRAVVNCNKERFSIPTFYCPSHDALIEPARDLINNDHPCIYRSFTYEEYYENFWNQGLRTESCIDTFKVSST